MKVILGKTPEELAMEEAKRSREIDAGIQQSIQERQMKLIALRHVQTRNKIIILATAAFFALILIIFGTYNTFFKKGLTETDVKTEVYTAINPYQFPSEGLNNYVRDSLPSLFEKYSDVEPTLYKPAEIDLNSVYIFKVKPVSSTFAHVYFSADVKISGLDMPVTDPALLDQLHKNGLGLRDEPTTVTPTVESTTEAVSTTTGEEISISISDDANSTEATTAVATTEASIPATDIQMSSDKTEDPTEYYLLSNGTIMQKGKTTTYRYNFYLPVEFYYGYDGDTPVTSGYRAAGEMSLYTLNETNQTDFDKITVIDSMKFNEDFKVEEETLKAAQIKVDKTISDLYSKRDTSQDFLNYRTFNSYDAMYTGITDFTMYSEPNALGFNAKVIYGIQTTQGFKFQTEAYLLIEKSGNSWVIKGIQ